MRKALVGVVLLVSLMSAHRAEAQAAFGVRTGLTDDPDSFFFGGHMAFHPRALRLFRIEPSLELGIGDIGNVDFLSMRFNLNLKYAIPVSPEAAFFPLFGPSIYYINIDDPVDDSETELGVNLGFGFAYAGFSFELAFGAADIPDITFTFTYTF